MQRTVVPVRSDTTGARRDLRSIPLDDAFNVLGALAAGLAVASLLFGWLTPMTGFIGWAVISFVAFIGIYAVLSSLRADRLTYEAPEDQAIAHGHVRISQDGNVYSGPELQLKVQRFEGFFIENLPWLEFSK